VKKLLFVAFALAAACNGKSDAPASADRPAVVQAPPVILPSDTAKPDTTAQHLEKMASLMRELSQPYALISAGIIFGDRRMVTSFYAPQAEVTIADSTYKGVTDVANALVAFGRRSGMTEWNRAPWRLTGKPDSIYIDSGYYVMTAQRPGGPKHQERGTYVATWRHIGGPDPWVLLKDHIVPGTGKAR
jgi:hypothetical protein